MEKSVGWKRGSKFCFRTFSSLKDYYPSWNSLVPKGTGGQDEQSPFCGNNGIVGFSRYRDTLLPMVTHVQVVRTLRALDPQQSHAVVYEQRDGHGLAI